MVVTGRTSIGKWVPSNDTELVVDFPHHTTTGLSLRGKNSRKRTYVLLARSYPGLGAFDLNYGFPRQHLDGEFCNYVMA